MDDQDVSKLRVALLRADLDPNRHANGFLPRYALLTRFLAEECSDLLVVLRNGREADDTAFVSEIPTGVSVSHIEIPGGSRSRSGRLSRALLTLVGLAAQPEWKADLEELLRQWAPDVIVAPAHPSRDYAGPLMRVAPTVLFIEEEPPPFETAKRSLGGRALQIVELCAERHVTAPPAVAVVISEPELDWGAKTFPRSVTKVVPLNLEDEYWDVTRAAERPLARSDVFTICRMDHERNAAGFAQISRALARIASSGARTPRLVVASSEEPHPAFSEGAHELIDFVGRVADPRPYYQSAGATLVPSFAVAGAKTTILQGWASKCPVVTTTTAAVSVGGTPGHDLFAGDTPDSVAEYLVRAVESRLESEIVAERGYRHYRDTYSERAVRDSLRKALTAASRSAPARASIIADSRAARALRTRSLRATTSCRDGTK